MIRDARELSSGTRLEADVCIVGAGPAGITLARALNDRKLSVLLIESGGYESDAGTTRLCRGEVTGWLSAFPDYLTASRARGLGGSSSLWMGTCAPFSPAQFAKRDWTSIPGWPFDLSELAPFYTEAATICDLVPKTDPPATSPFSLNSSDYAVETYRQSLPTRFGAKYRDELSKRSDVTVLLNTTVTEIRTDEARETVLEVKAAVVDGEQNLVIKAKGFILAAGALENARLLLVSRSLMSNRPHLIENVGSYFMEHPYLTIGSALFSSPTPFSNWTRRSDERTFNVLTTTASYQRRKGRPAMRFHVTENASFGSNKTTVRPELMIRQLCSEKSISPAAHELAWGRLSCVMEPVPCRTSRVTVAATTTDELGVPTLKLASNLSTDEITGSALSIRSFLADLSLGSRARVNLAPGLFGELEESVVALERLRYGAHHIGTTRMAQNSQSGVVDKNCKVFGLKNLFVAGSSVFPNAGTSNPTLTIVALALRLGAHINRMYSGASQ